MRVLWNKDMHVPCACLWRKKPESEAWSACALEQRHACTLCLPLEEEAGKRGLECVCFGTKTCMYPVFAF